MAPMGTQAHRALAGALVAKAVMAALRWGEAALVVPQVVVLMAATEVAEVITVYSAEPVMRGAALAARVGQGAVMAARSSVEVV